MRRRERDRLTSRPWSHEHEGLRVMAGSAPREVREVERADPQLSLGDVRYLIA
jgi:hypothetical protein